MSNAAHGNGDPRLTAGASHDSPDPRLTAGASHDSPGAKPRCAGPEAVTSPRRKPGVARFRNIV